MRRTKLRKLILGYILISVGVILVYTYLNWLIFVKQQRSFLDGMVRDIWLPIALPWLPLLIWVRPRLKQLKFGNRWRSAVGFFLYLGWLTGVATPLLMQKYMKTAAGGLTIVKGVDEIHGREATRYYTIGQYYIDTAHAGVWLSTSVGGKGHRVLLMNLYVVCPMFRDSVEGRFLGQTGGMPVAWMVRMFSKKTENLGSPIYKKEVVREFLGESKRQFDTTSLQDITYFDRVPQHIDDYEGCRQALERLLKGQNVFRPKVFLSPVKAPFSKRSGDDLFWVILSFVAGMSIWSWLLLISVVPDEAGDPTLPEP